MRTTSMALMLALALVGCGDDDGGGGDAGGGDDGGTPGEDAGPPGMCENSADMSGLMADYMVMGETQDVPTITGNCARMCALMGGDDMTMATCIRTCITDNTMMMISQPCIGCLLASVACARDNCLSDCLSDPSAPQCLACQCGDNDMMINCRTVFSDCAGFATTTCPMP